MGSPLLDRNSLMGCRLLFSDRVADIDRGKFCIISAWAIATLVRSSFAT